MMMVLLTWGVDSQSVAVRPMAHDGRKDSSRAYWNVGLVFPVSFAGAGMAQNAREVQLEGLEGPVEVHYDTYGMPHIFAGSWPDAYRTLGYIHATERLLQMDLYRRRASGTLAQVQGKGSLEEDILMRRLGIRRGCQEIWVIRVSRKRTGRDW